MLAEDKANQLQHMQTLAALPLVAVGVIFQLFLTMLEGGKTTKLLLLYFLHFKIRLHMGHCSDFGSIKATANLELTTQFGEASTQTHSSVVQLIASVPGSQGLAKCTSW